MRGRFPGSLEGKEDVLCSYTEHSVAPPESTGQEKRERFMEVEAGLACQRVDPNVVRQKDFTPMLQLLNPMSWVRQMYQSQTHLMLLVVLHLLAFATIVAATESDTQVRCINRIPSAY